jgi:hypothetical protein
MNVPITATPKTGSQFTSWSQTAGISSSFGNRNAASTTFLMPKSAATVYANGKYKKLTFQIATMADCGRNMYDDRGPAAYRNFAYTTARIGSLCWMTTNLDLPGGTTLTSADTNVPANYYTTTNGFVNGNTLPPSTTDFGDHTWDYGTCRLYNSNNTTCNGSMCYSYYSWRCATAGYNNSYDGETVPYDICPKGWRLPTLSEFNSLKDTYPLAASIQEPPFNAVYSGYIGNAFFSGGEHGFLWSGTGGLYTKWGNYDMAYYLQYFNTYQGGTVNGSVRTISNSKFFEISIRCVKSS